jgi:DNA-binding protein Fis
LQYVLALVEEKHIRRAMEICKGDNESAIKLLGISRGTFFERKKRYHL